MAIEQFGDENPESTEYNWETVELSLPADYKYLNVIGASIAALLERVQEISDKAAVTYSIELAVHEICTNIVEHAYKGRTARIQVAMHLHEKLRRLVIELIDSGQPFDWSAVAEPDLDVPQEGNYGLFLVRNLVDELDYRREKDENFWRLVKHF